MAEPLSAGCLALAVLPLEVRAGTAGAFMARGAGLRPRTRTAAGAAATVGVAAIRPVAARSAAGAGTTHSVAGAGAAIHALPADVGGGTATDPERLAGRSRAIAAIGLTPGPASLSRGTTSAIDRCIAPVGQHAARPRGACARDWNARLRAALIRTGTAARHPRLASSAFDHASAAVGCAAAIRTARSARRTAKVAVLLRTVQAGFQPRFQLAAVGAVGGRGGDEVAVGAARAHQRHDGQCRDCLCRSERSNHRAAIERSTNGHSTQQSRRPVSQRGQRARAPVGTEGRWFARPP